MKGIRMGFLIALVIISAASAAAQAPKAGGAGKEPTFRMQAINPDSRYEAATMADINKDGRLDIFSGGFWYEAPTWKKHFVREIEEKDEYYVDFGALPADINGDGWTDIVNAAWHNKAIFWIRNPGRSGKGFEVFTIDTPGNIETAIAADINGDGQTDFLPNAMNVVVWYEYKKDKSDPSGARWTRHEVSKEAAGHGLGTGDIDGDRRTDIVVPKGWLQQPAQASDPWVFHKDFNLGSTSVPMLVSDVDRDGDADLIYGLGHNYGLFWMEQAKGPDGKRSWTTHEIDKSWSQPHFLLLADLNKDGQQELVTGKRYRAHNGRDPGETDPRVIYYYRFDPASKNWSKYPVSQPGGPAAFGISTVAADIDKDGDIDILAPGKSGLYHFINELIDRKK